MAKKKSRSKQKSVKPTSGGGEIKLSPAVRRSLWILFSLVGSLFLSMAAFNLAGDFGSFFFNAWEQGIGKLTPAIPLLILWFWFRRYIPQTFYYRWDGVLTTVLSVIALLLSFAWQGDAPAGGIVGQTLYTGLISAFGLIFTQFLVVMLYFAAVIIAFHSQLGKIWGAVVEVQESRESQERPAPKSAPSPDLSVEELAKVPVIEGTDAAALHGPLAGLRRRIVAPDLKPSVPVHQLSLSNPRTPQNAWMYPPMALLMKVDSKPTAGNIQKRMEVIKKTLSDFGIDVTMAGVNVGPTVTQYEMKPSEGVKLTQITSRRDDLALALAAQSLRIEAPIPGKSAVGIEIPNEKKAVVGLRDILESDAFRKASSKLMLALGLDAAGQPVIADLARMPHCLIAGSTGSGKSVCINACILSLLVNNSPDELRLIMVDPKRVEMTTYNGIPHLLTPVITEPEDTVKALKWLVNEMDRRYRLLNSVGKRNLEQYNLAPDPGEGRLPAIVLVVDELADLMMVASREVESSIVRLAQMARAVGIHLMLATQRPSVDVITGLIKANIPTRMAFAVASQIDSRTILDQAGAEQLLGYGDMLYLSTDVPRPRRIQGARVLDGEISSVIAHIRQQEPTDRYNPSILETRVDIKGMTSRGGGDEVDDDMYEDAVGVVRQYNKASTTLLQTRLSVGYARAARLMTIMEDRGVIGPARGAKPREVYGVEATAVEVEDLL
jgi:S-DNA-T family DNA segregation ATPase FtsK/SpoIIIE